MMETKHTPTPWTIYISHGVATFYDADNQPIPELSEIELGWTDTSTGNYVDPTEREPLLNNICCAINAHDALVEAMEGMIKLICSIDWTAFSLADKATLDKARVALKLAKKG